MENFGKIFRKFREARNLTLKDVSGSYLSISQLSRFENEETDLTITKFMKALDAINMPIDEFIYATNDFHRDDLNELLEKIRSFIANRDIDSMEALLVSYSETNNDNKEIFHKLNTILIKIRLQDLSHKVYIDKGDLEYLTNYLFSVEFWGCYELLLFTNTLDFLNHNTFMILSREMCRRSDFYKEIPNNRRLISIMLLNAYITCIERSELIDALYFEKQLNICSFTEIEIYERLVFQYAKNFYKYRKLNTKQSIIEMRKCIGVMKLVSSYHLALTFEEHLENILRK